MTLISSAPSSIVPVLDSTDPAIAALSNGTLESRPVPDIEIAPQPNHPSRQQFWGVFGSSFITIFLAELGDKTQVATLLMSAKSQAPWTVFLGAACALLTTSLLGVLLGRWLSTRLSPKTLDTAAGILLAAIALWLLWDVSQP